MQVAENLRAVREKIERVRDVSGINYDISIVAVTKTHPSPVIVESVRAGLSEIGENRVQEAEAKFSEIKDIPFVKHLIGHLQSNKASKAAQLFDWIQSIDDAGLAEKVSRKALELGKTIRVLIEVKTSEEAAKTGIAPELAAELAGRIFELPALELRGLMTIAPFTSVEREVRKAFSSLYGLYEGLKSEYPAAKLDTLSMGMSDDYLWAIGEGSNMIRLGRTLFGAR